MRSIREFASHTLRFRQPQLMTMRYELTAGDILVGEIEFRSAFGTFATGRCADGVWTFKRVGFWQSRATVRAEGADRDLASFQFDHWRGGGTLAFAEGRTYRAVSNFWHSRFEIRDASDEALVRWSNQLGLKMAGEVEIQHAARTLEELPVLLLFGWYLQVMLSQDSGAGAAVAAAT